MLTSSHLVICKQSIALLHLHSAFVVPMPFSKKLFKNLCCLILITHDELKVICHLLCALMRNSDIVSALQSSRRRCQWWVKTSLCLSLRTLLLLPYPRRTWLHPAHRITVRPTRSTLFLLSRSGSTSLCELMSNENMITSMDPGVAQKPHYSVFVRVVLSEMNVSKQ